jgi:hypothetical protein
LVGRFGPFEGPGILVVPIDEGADIGYQARDGGSGFAAAVRDAGTVTIVCDHDYQIANRCESSCS